MNVRNGLGEVGAAADFLRGLRPFLRGCPTVQVARARLEQQLAGRDRTFANVLHRAVFERSTSPYRRLLEWAGISAGDIDEMLEAVGVEGTLEQLHDAGVHISLEEFKGLRPVCRPGLEIPVRAEDFDNPLSARQYEARTGGSGGAARRIVVGLDLLDHESAYHALFYAAPISKRRPAAMWLPAPPGAVGIKNALIRARLGQPVVRWFSQTRLHDGPVKHRAFASATRSATRLWGSRIPRPVFTPADRAINVAAWLDRQRATGQPAMLLTLPSAAVRTCAAAVAGGLDITGTFFVLVGEPLTIAKSSIIEGAGCSVACHYAMVEAGMIGLACLAPGAPDDVHLVSDKIATIQRERAVGDDGRTVPALLHSTLLAASPKVMLNVESGDYGVLEERTCGCGVLPVAYRRHLHTIRSYEKLTGEGMHFLGPDLLLLLETVLPARFGGQPTDYQLVEREQDGVTRVDLVVSPAVGKLETADVVRTALEFLRHRGIGQRLMAEVWSNGETLQVVRTEPHVTSAGKIQPLRKLGA
jgi:hypothetical protein